MGTIVAVTIGSDTYDVYSISADPIVDATAFYNGLLGTASTEWAAATADDQKRSLVGSADWMDRAVGHMLSGTKTVVTQSREWPRDGAECDGTPVTDGTTPDIIATAQFWLAGQILIDNAIVESTGEGSNVKKVAAGSANVSFFVRSAGSSLDTRLPITATDYLKCYFTGASVSGAGVAYGTAGATAFTTDDWERQEGFS